MKCKYCNTENDLNNSFCKECGKSLKEELNNQENTKNEVIAPAPVVEPTSLNGTPTTPVVEPTSLNGTPTTPVVEPTSLNGTPTTPVVEPTSLNKTPTAPVVEQAQGGITTQNSIVNETSNNPQKTKKSSKTVFVVIIVILILFAALFFGWKYFNSSKFVFSKVIDKLYVETMNKIPNDAKSIDASFDFKINTETTDDSLKSLDDIGVNAKFGVDFKNKYISADLDYNISDTLILDGNIYVENSKLYVYAKDILNTYVNFDIPTEEFNKIFDMNGNIDDLQFLISKVKEAFKKSLKENYFEMEKEGGLNKLTLTIDESNEKQILLDIWNILKQDKEFTKKIGITDNETIKEISKEFENYTASSNVITLSIYTKGFNHNVEKISVEYNSILGVIGIYITNKSNEYTMSLMMNDITYLTGNFVSTNNSLKSKININTGETVIDFEGNASVVYNGTIEKKDVSNSVNYDDLSEEEANQIYTNLLNNPISSMIYESITDNSISEIDDELSGYNNLAEIDDELSDFNDWDLDF